jgi:hypothetical protein
MFFTKIYFLSYDQPLWVKKHAKFESKIKKQPICSEILEKLPHVGRSIKKHCPGSELRLSFGFDFGPIQRKSAVAIENSITFDRFFG